MLDHHQLQTVFDHLTQALLTIDTQGVITLVNGRLDSLVGLPSGALKGRVLSDLDEATLFALGFDRVGLGTLLYQLQTGDWSAQNSGAEYALEHPYQRFIQRTHIPLHDVTGESTGLLLLFTDTTTTRDLYQAQGQIISMIVHDLRSPLSAITSSMNLLKEMADPQDEFGGMVLKTSDISGRAARKLLNLVNSLLDVSKMEAGMASLEPEIVDLNGLLKVVIAELQPLAGEMDVELELVGLKKIPFLSVDTDKIERVFYNLIDNAIKFSPAGKTVVIAAQLLHHDFVRVEVRDNGSGIPDNYKPILFNRFQQVEDNMARRRGTGLGLTFCKLAIEAHGGTIWIEDNPDGGSIFVFTLPIKQ